MAELATQIVYDDAPTSKTFEPSSDNVLIENNVGLAPMARAQVTFQGGKFGVTKARRIIKLDVPVMESIGSAGTQEGYVAAPKVAHTIGASVAIFCDESRATPTEIAHALKLLINYVLGDATAGTANAYRDATNSARKFLIAGVGGD